MQYERAQTMRKSNIIFKSVRVRLRESFRLRECVNPEFDSDKNGIEKSVLNCRERVSVSRGGASVGANNTN